MLKTLFFITLTTLLPNFSHAYCDSLEQAQNIAARDIIDDYKFGYLNTGMMDSILLHGVETPISYGASVDELTAAYRAFFENVIAHYLTEYTAIDGVYTFTSQDDVDSGGFKTHYDFTVTTTCESWTMTDVSSVDTNIP